MFCVWKNLKEFCKPYNFFLIILRVGDISFLKNWKHFWQLPFPVFWMFWKDLGIPWCFSKYSERLLKAQHFMKKTLVKSCFLLKRTLRTFNLLYLKKKDELAVLFFKETCGLPMFYYWKNWKNLVGKSGVLLLGEFERILDVLVFNF